MWSVFYVRSDGGDPCVCVCLCRSLRTDYLYLNRYFLNFLHPQLVIPATSLMSQRAEMISVIFADNFWNAFNAILHVCVRWTPSSAGGWLINHSHGEFNSGCNNDVTELDVLFVARSVGSQSAAPPPPADTHTWLAGKVKQVQASLGPALAVSIMPVSKNVLMRSSLQAGCSSHSSYSQKRRWNAEISVRSPRITFFLSSHMIARQ